VKSRFQLLLRLFRDRFLENDTVSPGGGFQTNIYQMLGVLIAVPVIAGFFVMPEFLALSLRPTSAQTEWALQSLRLWFIVLLGFLIPRPPRFPDSSSFSDPTA
jgi:hypothetical protein